MPPLIGITTDLENGRYHAAASHGALVAAAGAIPIMLTCRRDCVSAYLDRCDGFILTGGDDPRMDAWHVAMHPKAKAVHPDRQSFEIALLEALKSRPEVPVLGICLGMQLMGLHAGGTLDQHLPDTLATADRHWGRVEHEIDGALGSGVVHSHHRQALTEPGTMRVIAQAPDGVIEAIDDPRRAHYVGVQWHPERTDDARLGSDLVRALVGATAVRSA